MRTALSPGLLACAFLIVFLAGPLPQSSGVESKGGEYMELRQVAAGLGMKSSWLVKDKVLRLKSDWTEMRFTVHKREMLLNGKRLFMGYPVRKTHGDLEIRTDDLEYLIRPLLTPQLFDPVPGLRHIIIDPGHGGDDPGAQNSEFKLLEKSLTLDLARKLERELERRGFAVSLTRRKDAFIPLKERCRIANRMKGDLFISIHFNASGKPSVSGIETYALTPPGQPSTSRSKLADSDRKHYRGQDQGPWNTLLAYYVQRSLVDSMDSPDRGLKRAQFVVLRELEMPGILVEGGFVSHPREGRNIGSATYREELAKAIADGVIVYQRTLTRLRN